MHHSLLCILHQYRLFTRFLRHHSAGYQFCIQFVYHAAVLSLRCQYIHPFTAAAPAMACFATATDTWPSGDAAIDQRCMDCAGYHTPSAGGIVHALLCSFRLSDVSYSGTGCHAKGYHRFVLIQYYHAH